MPAKPEDLLLQAWKQQLDLGLRMVETIVESSVKLRQMQRELYDAATRASPVAHPPAPAKAKRSRRAHAQGARQGRAAN